MAKSEQINELALALSKVQGEIEGAVKDALNPHFKSKYADLTSCWEACREQLSKYEIAVVQSNDDTDTHLCLTTTLIHKSGQWIDGTLKMERKVDDKGARRDMNAQQIGSAITYFRRYALCSMIGICPEDNDANDISQKTNNNSRDQTCYLMTPDQICEIEGLLKQCSDEYVKGFNAYLKNTLKVSSINLIDSRYYSEIKKYALINIETTKAKVVTLEDKNPLSVFDGKDTALVAKELHDKKEAALKELKEKKIENAKFGK